MFSVDFSHDGCKIASGSWDNTVKIWVDKKIRRKREKFLFLFLEWE